MEAILHLLVDRARFHITLPHYCEVNLRANKATKLIPCEGVQFRRRARHIDDVNWLLLMKIVAFLFGLWDHCCFDNEGVFCM